MITIWKSLIKAAADATQTRQNPGTQKTSAATESKQPAQTTPNAPVDYTKVGGPFGNVAYLANKSVNEAKQLQQKKDLGKFLGTMLASEKERQYIDNRPNPVSGLSTTGLESYRQQTETYKQPTNIPVTPNTPQIQPGRWLRYYKPKFYAGQNPYQLD